ncbi:MAG TPA: TSUP family transporter [Syntrophorhabdaceae bacterium]|nr:TSUP family transporter [Syntrophorhabdaceae bacterium]
MIEIGILCVFAFFAGFIDSVAGGGGLIQLPALLLVFPGQPVPLLLGTNKFASIAGTSLASVQYARHIQIHWKATLPAMCAALIFSFLGARATTIIKPDVMRPLILVMLIMIAVYTFIRKDLGSIHFPKLSEKTRLATSVLTGMVIGFYDGFFGPGTGSFLIFVFIGIFGFNFLSASASSKLINFATNLSAVLYFGFTNNILYSAAVFMALSNMAGSYTGTHLAILKGSRFIRVFFLAVVSVLIIKLAYDMFIAP